MTESNKPLMASDSFSLTKAETSSETLSRRLSYYFKPSLFTHSPAKARGPTAYLDGLRGWAAFLVYTTHHILHAHMSIPLELGWGTGGKNYFFVNFPLIRTLFTGSHVAVHVFFVISGFVLSRGTLAHIHQNVDADRIVAGLASATSRRWVRLWIPVAGSTFIVMTLLHMFGYESEFRRESYFLEIVAWLFSLYTIASPFNSQGWVNVNSHTWTIPYEFRGSMYVFLCLLGTHKMTKLARMSLFCLMGLWAHCSNVWMCSAFLAGAVLAEIDLLRDSDWSSWPWLTTMQKQKTKIYMILIPFALHLGGQPARAFGALTLEDYAHTDGFYYLSLIIPKAYEYNLNDFYYTPAAIIIVSATMFLPWFRSLFEMRFTQYLGRISYGFYLVHGPILTMLGEKLYTAAGFSLTLEPPVHNGSMISNFGSMGIAGVELSFLACHLIMLPLTFYLAELCTKMFDEPAIRIARGLYQKTLA